MRRRLGLLVMASCLAAACGSVDVEKERQALLALDREWSAQVKDIDKFLAKYAPEGSLSLPGLPAATGQINIRNAATAFAAASPGFSIRWSPSKADVGASGDMGYTAGTYQIVKDHPAGTPVRENGKYVEVWKKDPVGQWKVMEFIFNPDGPAPAK